MKNYNNWVLLAFLSLIFSSSIQTSSAAQCGWQAGGALCPGGLCCSEFGWCGSTEPWCGPGCQSQCRPSPAPGPPPAPPTPPAPPAPPAPGGGISGVISAATFNEMLKHRNNVACLARGFYTYEAFIAAAGTFPSFGTTGDDATRKREIAAFLAQTSHETTGGWASAPDGPFAWGYCFLREVNPTHSYCQPSSEWPCAPGKQYFGRGPIQLSWNYNYGQCGRDLRLNLLNDPDLVTSDPVIAFRTSLWFWMTPQTPKPSSHDVIIGRWTPSPADLAAGRVPGYGVITNIINGGLECGRGPDPRVQSRIGFFRRYCSILGITTGDNLDCGNQRPFGSGLVSPDHSAM